MPELRQLSKSSKKSGASNKQSGRKIAIENNEEPIIKSGSDNGAQGPNLKKSGELNNSKNGGRSDQSAGQGSPNNQGKNVVEGPGPSCNINNKEITVPPVQEGIKFGSKDKEKQENSKSQEEQLPSAPVQQVEEPPKIMIDTTKNNKKNLE